MLESPLSGRSVLDVIRREAMQIVGYQTRTTNAAEASPETSQLGPLWERALQPGVFDTVANRSNAGRLVAVLHDYESDESGEYSDLLVLKSMHSAAVFPRI